MKTDAEKFAKVFRAAADGIANGVVPREVHAEWVSRIRTRSEPIAEGDQEYERFIATRLTQRSSHYVLAMYQGFSGVAAMFEKIVEAEKPKKTDIDQVQI